MSYASCLAPQVGRSPTLIGVGGVAWTGDPHVVYSTLLGSCIAVCLWDPEARKGGINHFLLAEAPQKESDDTRYGSVSLPLLVSSLCSVGCRKSRLRCVLAGGADLLSNMKPIGTENGQFALQWLREEGVAIGRRDIGGQSARRVRFVPTTGDCIVTEVGGSRLEAASVKNKVTPMGYTAAL